MRSRPLLYFCLKIHTLFWNNPISYLRMASCFQLSCQAEKMMYFEPKHYNSATISTNFYQILNTSLTDLHASWSWLTHTHTHTHTRACTHAHTNTESCSPARKAEFFLHLNFFPSKILNPWISSLRALVFTPNWASRGWLHRGQAHRLWKQAMGFEYEFRYLLASQLLANY